MQRRKVTYKLYPTPRQCELLLILLRQHCELWNAALEERISAWRAAGKSIGYSAQCTSLTQIRSELPGDWAQMNCSSQQITLRRLDKAFSSFFRRVKTGQSPGFPRFKSLSRMPGFGYKGHGDGWRFTPSVKTDGSWARHGSLRLQGVGQIRARGQARVGGTIKSCELMHSHGEWHVSLTLEVADEALAALRPRDADHAMAADWGVEKLLTLVRTDGAHGEAVETIDNPRWFKTGQQQLLDADRAVSRKRRGSGRWKKAAKARSRLRAKFARRRHDHQHQLSADIASRCAIFASEALSIKNMTASAAGTMDEPGKNVQQKAGLNREILDTAPAALFQKIAYKVPETGGQVLEAPTKKLKPSQTCPECGAVHKKTLAERVHHCGSCGHEEDRDSAAARIVLRWAIGQQSPGQELPDRP